MFATRLILKVHAIDFNIHIHSGALGGDRLGLDFTFEVLCRLLQLPMLVFGLYLITVAS